MSIYRIFIWPLSRMGLIQGPFIVGGYTRIVIHARPSHKLIDPVSILHFWVPWGASRLTQQCQVGIAWEEGSQEQVNVSM